MAKKSVKRIHTEDVSSCPACGFRKRSTLYNNLEDRLFGTPGKWTFKQCASCGLVYLNHRPTHQDTPYTYTDAYARRKVIGISPKKTIITKIKDKVKNAYLSRAYGYRQDEDSRQPIFSFPIYIAPKYREQLAYSVMRLHSIRNGRLLDIGCGVGIFLKQMSDLNWQVEGLDTDPKVIQICRKSGLSVREGSLENQNYPDNYFDAITMKHVIEHVFDPIRLLKECKRILKPSGKLIILTPNVESLAHKIFKSDWLGLDISRHLVLFSAKSLSITAEQAGLKIISFSTTCRISEFIWLVSYNLKKYDKNIYFSRASLSSRVMSKIFDKKVRALLLRDRWVGDELAMILEK